MVYGGGGGGGVGIVIVVVVVGVLCTKWLRGGAHGHG